MLFGGQGLHTGGQGGGHGRGHGGGHSSEHGWGHGRGHGSEHGSGHGSGHWGGHGAGHGGRQVGRAGTAPTAHLACDNGTIGKGALGAKECVWIGNDLAHNGGGHVKPTALALGSKPIGELLAEALQAALNGSPKGLPNAWKPQL